MVTENHDRHYYLTGPGFSGSLWLVKKDKWVISCVPALREIIGDTPVKELRARLVKLGFRIDGHEEK